MIQVSKITISKIEGYHQPGNSFEGSDDWEQADAHLKEWSTASNRLNKVNFLVLYENDVEYCGRLQLPWFEDGVRQQSFPRLGMHMLETMEQISSSYGDDPVLHARALQDALFWLRNYEIGAQVMRDEVEACLERVESAK